MNYKNVLIVMALMAVSVSSFGETTRNVSIELMEANEAMPHITINDFMYKSDVFLFAGLSDYPVSASPVVVSATDGDLYIVPTGGEGDWSGKDGQLAYLQDSAWKFVEPATGFMVNAPEAGASELRLLGYNDSIWSQVVVTAATFTNLELPGYLTVGATATIAQQLKIGSATQNMGLNTQLVIYDDNGIASAAINTNAESDVYLQFATDYDNSGPFATISLDHSVDELVLSNSSTFRRDIAIDPSGNVTLEYGALTISNGTMSVTGTVTANAFDGDGSAITGISVSDPLNLGTLNATTKLAGQIVNVTGDATISGNVVVPSGTMAITNPGSGVGFSLGGGGAYSNAYESRNSAYPGYAWRFGRSPTTGGLTFTEVYGGNETIQAYFAMATGDLHMGSTNENNVYGNTMYATAYVTNTDFQDGDALSVIDAMSYEIVKGKKVLDHSTIGKMRTTWDVTDYFVDVKQKDGTLIKQVQLRKGEGLIRDVTQAKAFLSTNEIAVKAKDVTFSYFTKTHQQEGLDLVVNVAFLNRAVQQLIAENKALRKLLPD